MNRHTLKIYNNIVFFCPAIELGSPPKRERNSSDDRPRGLAMHSCSGRRPNTSEPCHVYSDTTAESWWGRLARALHVTTTSQRDIRKMHKHFGATVCLDDFYPSRLIKKRSPPERVTTECWNFEGIPTTSPNGVMRVLSLLLWLSYYCCYYYYDAGAENHFRPTDDALARKT